MNRNPGHVRVPAHLPSYKAARGHATGRPTTPTALKTGYCINQTAQRQPTKQLAIVSQHQVHYHRVPRKYSSRSSIATVTPTSGPTRAKAKISPVSFRPCTVIKISAFSVLQHGVPQGTGPIARNFLRLKIHALAGFPTEPWTITSYSWEYSQV